MYGPTHNWVGGIGAYYVGRPFGKHKLAPHVSPNKSWEGSMASVFTSALVGTIYLQLFLPSVPLWQAISLTGPAHIAGQLGDLREYALKRGPNLKHNGG